MVTVKSQSMIIELCNPVFVGYLVSRSTFSCISKPRSGLRGNPLAHTRALSTRRGAGRGGSPPAL